MSKADEKARLTELLLKQKKQIARKKKAGKGSARRKIAATKAHRMAGKIAAVRERIAALNAKRSGADKAVGWFMSQQGVAEHPDGSNWGHPVQDWITYTGYSSPVPWCGCGAAVAVVREGGANIPTRIHLGYTGTIESDARENKNGLKAVPWEKGRKGDIVVFSFGHIAVLREDNHPGISTCNTIEANTSPLRSGSQADGGTIAAKTRNRSDVTVIARPAY